MTLRHRPGELLLELSDDFPIVTIEDPFDQDDWDNWASYNGAVSEKLQVVADDLTVTNPKKIQQAVDTNAANCLLLKVNQIGSVTESINAVKLAKQNRWGVMTSTVRVDRGFVHRGPRRGPAPVTPELPPDLPSTTVCSASRRSWPAEQLRWNWVRKPAWMG